MKIANLALIASASAVLLDTEVKGQGCITMDDSNASMDEAIVKAHGKLDEQDVFNVVMAWTKVAHHVISDDLWMWVGWRSSQVAKGPDLDE